MNAKEHNKRNINVYDKNMSYVEKYLITCSFII